MLPYRYTAMQRPSSTQPTQRNHLTSHHYNETYEIQTQRHSSTPRVNSGNPLPSKEILETTLRGDTKQRPRTQKATPAMLSLQEWKCIFWAYDQSSLAKPTAPRLEQQSTSGEVGAYSETSHTRPKGNPAIDFEEATPITRLHPYKHKSHWHWKKNLLWNRS